MLAFSAAARRRLPLRRCFSTGGIESVRARSLDEVVKLGAFAQLSLGDVEDLWRTYHVDKDFQLGRTLRTPSALLGRVSQCPQYVVPVIKESVGFFVMFAEYQASQQTSFMTPLEEYTKSPKYCQPWLSLQFFTDIPGIILCQANFLKNLPKGQAAGLVDLYLSSYVDDEAFTKHTSAMTQRPSEFEFSQAFPQVAPFLSKAQQR